MKILKFLFLLPLLAIGAQALEPKIVMKPEASLKNGLYYVKGKLYDGTLKMLRYSVEDLYDVNAMGHGLSEAKAAAAHAYTRDRRTGRHGGAIQGLF